MKVVVGPPPVYEAICAAIGTPPETTIFTWGDTVYSLSGPDISPELDVHESVHRDQQRDVGGPNLWWERYLIDPPWRVEQEVAAYQAQFAFLRTHVRDRNDLTLWRRAIASALSGPTYGKVMTFADAYLAIARAKPDIVMAGRARGR